MKNSEDKNSDKKQSLFFFLNNDTFSIAPKLKEVENNILGIDVESLTVEAKGFSKVEYADFLQMLSKRKDIKHLKLDLPRLGSSLLEIQIPNLETLELSDYSLENYNLPLFCNNNKNLKSLALDLRKKIYRAQKTLITKMFPNIKFEAPLKDTKLWIEKNELTIELKGQNYPDYECFISNSTNPKIDSIVIEDPSNRKMLGVRCLLIKCLQNGGFVNVTKIKLNNLKNEYNNEYLLELIDEIKKHSTIELITNKHELTSNKTTKIDSVLINKSELVVTKACTSSAIIANSTNPKIESIIIKNKESSYTTFLYPIILCLSKGGYKDVKNINIDVLKFEKDSIFITELIEQLDKLQFLEKLTLKGCALENEKVGLLHSKSLVKLDCSNNNSSDLDNSVFEALFFLNPSLKFLNWSGNRIHDLDSCIKIMRQKQICITIDPKKVKVINNNKAIVNDTQVIEEYNKTYVPLYLKNSNHCISEIQRLEQKEVFITFIWCMKASEKAEKAIKVKWSTGLLKNIANIIFNFSVKDATQEALNDFLKTDPVALYAKELGGEELKNLFTEGLESSNLYI